MNANIKQAIYHAVRHEPFARTMDMQLVHLERGHSIVEMVYRPESMSNIYERAHGGALFALIDEAFETASQTHGQIAVALNVNVAYVASPEPGVLLRAEAREISRTRKTAMYDIRVTADTQRLIATCQALAYRTGKPLPFVSPD